MTAFQPGDRVRVAGDATVTNFDTTTSRSGARGQEAVIVSGPDGDGDYRMRIVNGDFDGYYAHGSFLTLIDSPRLAEWEREILKAGEPEFIDPATLPEGWTLCEVEMRGGARCFLECNREGRYRTADGDETGYWLDEHPWRIVRVVEPADLPVIEPRDILDLPAGAVYERRTRFDVKAAGRHSHETSTYHLVSAPEPDPDAEKREALDTAVGVALDVNEPSRHLLEALHAAGWDLVKVGEQS